MAFHSKPLFPAPPGKVWICRPRIKLRTGKVLIAADYGLKAFCFLVDG